MTSGTQRKGSRKSAFAIAFRFSLFWNPARGRLPPRLRAGSCGRSWAKYGACAQYRAHDGRSQRGSDVACANFGDPGRHRVRKITAERRAGAPFLRGDHLGGQHAGGCRIMPDSRRGSPTMRLGRPRALFSNLFTVREETRGKRGWKGAAFLLPPPPPGKRRSERFAPRIRGRTGRGRVLDWT